MRRRADSLAVVASWKLGHATAQYEDDVENGTHWMKRA